MNKMTCEEIDGICDTVIEGSNFEEFLFNRLWHLQQAATIYPAHRRVLEEMALMSGDEKARWEENGSYAIVPILRLPLRAPS